MARKDGAALSREQAEQILAVFDAIDTDHPRDFVDLVCTARDVVPDSTVALLRAIAKG